MNIKIFRANRGEGKTKWLFERAADEYSKGKFLCYVGDRTTMKGFVGLWEANFHEKCPIVHIDDVDRFPDPCCFVTDGIVENLLVDNEWDRPTCIGDDIWYIAAEKEYFIN